MRTIFLVGSKCDPPILYMSNDQTERENKRESVNNVIIKNREYGAEH